MIAHYIGALSGAIVDLRWGKVEFEKNVIDFTVPDTGGIEVKRRPRAIAPTAPPLRAYLLARLEGDVGVPEYVLHQKRDINRRVKSVARGFRTTAKRLGLDDVSPHTLRHMRLASALVV